MGSVLGNWFKAFCLPRFFSFDKVHNLGRVCVIGFFIIPRPYAFFLYDLTVKGGGSLHNRCDFTLLNLVFNLLLLDYLAQDLFLLVSLLQFFKQFSVELTFFFQALPCFQLWLNCVLVDLQENLYVSQINWVKVFVCDGALVLNESCLLDDDGFNLGLLLDLLPMLFVCTEVMFD